MVKYTERDKNAERSLHEFLQGTTSPAEQNKYDSGWARRRNEDIEEILGNAVIRTSSSGYFGREARELARGRYREICREETENEIRTRESYARKNMSCEELVKQMEYEYIDEIEARIESKYRNCSSGFLMESAQQEMAGCRNVSELPFSAKEKLMEYYRRKREAEKSTRKEMEEIRRMEKELAALSKEAARLKNEEIMKYVKVALSVGALAFWGVKIF